MPIAKVQFPDGRVGRFEVPEGTTEEQVLAFAEENKLMFSEDAGRQKLDTQPSHTVGTSPTVDEQPDPTVGYGFEGVEMATKGFVRPALESVGMIGGGVVGSALGPAGTVGGAGLGFAAGRQAADILMGELPQETPLQTGYRTVRNIATGAAYESGGQIASKAIGAGVSKIGSLGRWVKSHIPVLSKQGYEAKAGEHLVATTSYGDIYVRNAHEAALLEKEIPGIRFTRAQRTGDVAAIKQEQGLISTRGPASQIDKELLADNNIAIGKYMKEKFPQAENMDDVVALIKKQSEGLEANITSARGQLTERLREAESSPSQIETGRTLREDITSKRGSVKQRVGKKFQEIPDESVDAKQLFVEMKKIKKGFDPDIESSGDMPSKIIHGIIKKIKSGEGKLKFSDMRKIRTNILDEIRTESGAASPNARKLRRLNQVKDAWDELSDMAGESNEAYREAASKWRKEYVEPFKQGPVKDVLSRRGTGEFSTSDVDVGTKFWQVGSKGAERAGKLIKAIGGEKAKANMRAFAAQDMASSVTNPSTGEIVPQKLYAWINKYKPALKRYGLLDEFSKVNKAARVLDDAVKTKAAFDNTSLANVLKSDPENAIKTVFSGPGSMGEKASNLMKMLGGNKSAVAGAQDEFAHMILNEAKTTGIDIRDNPLTSIAKFEKLYSKYAPAMRVLFKNNPEKLKALARAKRAFRIMSKSKQPVGVGSNTAEKTAEQLASMSGPLLSSRYAVVNAIRMFGKSASNIGNEQINIILAKAMIDPNLAARLTALGSGKLSKEVAKREMNSILSTLSIYGVFETGEN